MKKGMMDLMTRREAVKLGGLALGGAALLPLNMKAAGKAKPRQTARNVIFVQVCGGISPWDTWDFKEQAKQAKDLDVRKTASGIYLSKTLFPNLSDHTDKVSFVRSIRGNELVHFNAQYRHQAGRPLAPAIAKEVPALGSVVAYELGSQRREADTFPAYVSLNVGVGEPGSIGPGFFPAKFQGFDLAANQAFDTFGADDSEGQDRRLEEHRWNVLTEVSELANEEGRTLGDKQGDYRAYYHDAYRIMSDPRWPKVFKVTEQDRERYGAQDEGGYVNAVMLARNLLAADAGTRFIYIDESRLWDQHTKIFDRTAKDNHYSNCLRWEKAYVSLLTDLAQLPGREAGKSLLDETLIVTGSEFGRTPEINPVAGRHHWRDAFTWMFAGGGIKGGRIIGATDSKGYVSDTGWKHKEQPYIDNVAATVYSALGIDWLKRVENTPSGRAYDYVQTAPLGSSEFQSNDAIDELWA